MLAAATTYAELGLRIFPIDRDSKRPLTEHGHLDATDDVADVRECWSQVDANIGLSLRASGFVAVDVDPRNGGDEQLEDIETEIGSLPRECQQATPSGGRHFLMRDMPERRARGKIVWRGEGQKGLDVKCRGYVLVEPSSRPDGNEYRWLSLELDAVPEIPEAWVDLIYHPLGSEATAPDAVGHLDAWRESSDPEISDADLARLARHLDNLGGRGEGKNTTYRAVAAIFHDWGLSVDAGWDLLVAWNAGSGKPHDERELHRQLQRIAGREQIGRRGRAREDVPLATKIARAGLFDKQNAQAGPPTDQKPLTPDDPDDDPPPPADPNRPARRAAPSAEELSAAIACAAVAKPAPARDKIDAHLTAVERAWQRSSDPRKIVDARRIKEARRLAWIPPADADPDQAYAELGTALVRACATQIKGSSVPDATDLQLAVYLGPSLRAEDAVGAIAAARAMPVISIGAPGSWGNGPPAPEGDPVDDDEVRAGLLLTKDGAPRACGANVERILRFSAETKGAIEFDELSKTIRIARGRFAGPAASETPTEIANWLGKEWNLFPSDADVGAQILLIAKRGGQVDALLDYLAGLTWDGIERIDRWLETYCGVEEDVDFARLVGPRFLVSAVARGLCPGSKVDTVLVLEGAQGAKKSTAIRILSEPWFTDTPIDISTKDGRMVAAVKWIAELAELATIQRSTVEAQKNFLSQSSDFYRPPYGKVNEEFPRRCVFFGTMNPQPDGEARYLLDETGNRRWWPVRCSDGEVDVVGLGRDRDQLWAEAVVRYRRCAADTEAGVVDPPDRWWLTREEQRTASAVIAKREEESSLSEPIEAWLARNPGTTAFLTTDIAERALAIDAKDLKRHEHTIGRALRELGFARDKSKTTRDGRRGRFWTRAPVKS